MTPTVTSRTTHFSLILAEEDGRVLTVGGDAAPAIFSSEGEAGLFLQHLAGGGDGWRAWQITPEELMLLLCGPYAGAKRIALDPLPEMFADPLLVDLISVDKDHFLERYVKEPRLLVVETAALEEAIPDASA
jgi:hypothetical protein